MFAHVMQGFPNFFSVKPLWHNIFSWNLNNLFLFKIFMIELIISFFINSIKNSAVLTLTPVWETLE